VLRYSAPAPSLIPENEEIIDELPASPAAATPEGTPAANPMASPAASPTAESQAG
jgi:hypothetical protein